jgi:hypothetical protein
MHPITDPAERDPAVFTVVFAVIFGLPDVIPSEHDNPGEVHAVLAQVEQPLGIVPLVFQIATGRMSLQ